MKDKERVAIIMHSGAYDRASLALNLALAALSCDMEVHMLLTFGGLRRFTKRHIAEMGEETSPSLTTNIQQGLEWGAIQPLEEQLADVKKLGLKMYACPNSMAALNIGLRDLCAEVDDVMGLPAFLQLARTAVNSWYV